MSHLQTHPFPCGRYEQARKVEQDRENELQPAKEDFSDLVAEVSRRPETTRWSHFGHNLLMWTACGTDAICSGTGRSIADRLPIVSVQPGSLFLRLSCRPSALRKTSVRNSVHINHFFEFQMLEPRKKLRLHFLHLRIPLHLLAKANPVQWSSFVDFPLGYFDHRLLESLLHLRGSNRFSLTFTLARVQNEKKRKRKQQEKDSKGKKQKDFKF